jgi:hypothetical protein
MRLIDQLLGKAVPPLWFESEQGREGAFNAIALSEGKRIPVVGTKIAREGIAFVSNVEVRGTDVPLTFTIRRRTIPSRVRIVKDEHVRAAARVVHRYLCSFTTIAADDWDAIGRYVENTPEPEAIESALSEDARSLPVHIVTKVVEQLVRLKRLNAPTGTSAPLIRLEMGPVFDLTDGRRVRDVTVVSRLRASSAIRTYHTRFRIFADDRLEVLA